jgi:hypothetical protein
MEINFSSLIVRFEGESLVQKVMSNGTNVWLLLCRIERFLLTTIEKQEKVFHRESLASFHFNIVRGIYLHAS